MSPRRAARYRAGEHDREGSTVDGRTGPRDPPARQQRGRAEVGARLRALRVERGVTLPTLAAAVGVSKGYLSDVENGHKMPSVDVLDALADRLGLVVVDLLEGTWPYGRAGEGRGRA